MSRRGRPPGRTVRGAASRQALYDVAIELFDAHGYEQTTLRGIADAAGVSPGLLYKYFPNKQALVMELYAQLSQAFAQQLVLEPSASWTDRVHATLGFSLRVLRPHRATLSAVLPVLLADREHGLLSRNAYPSRRLVRDAYVQAVVGAAHPPSAPHVLGRLSYFLQLGVLLWWLLDRSEEQRATDGLMGMLGSLGPALGPMLWIPGVTRSLEKLDRLVADALYDDPLG
jgi:AcrR family transcriptional regulator